MEEILFQGQSEIMLDDKGRITVPARQRDNLRLACDGVLTVTKGFDQGLYLFPRPVWLKFRAALMALPAQDRHWVRRFIGSADDVSIDGASRLLIAPELREWAGFQKKLVLAGVGSRLELWDADRMSRAEAATDGAPVPESLSQMLIG